MPFIKRAGIRWLSKVSTKREPQQPRASTPHTAQVLADDITPSQVCRMLDDYVVGQHAAKQALARALRDRWRRMQLPREQRAEIAPNHVLLTGPTGCGKTELAKRVTKLFSFPFAKVEATQFTEVGYHGKSVDEMVECLVQAGTHTYVDAFRKQHYAHALGIARERLAAAVIKQVPSKQKPLYRQFLQKSPLVEQLPISVRVPNSLCIVTPQGKVEHNCHTAASDQVPLSTPLQQHDTVDFSSVTPGLYPSLGNVPDAALVSLISSLERHAAHHPTEDQHVPPRQHKQQRVASTSQGQGIKRIKLQGTTASTVSNGTEVPVHTAVRLFLEDELAIMFQSAYHGGAPGDIQPAVKSLIQEQGVVFVDELDKLASTDQGRLDPKKVSGHGVQRDLLSILSGCSVDTSIGSVNTEHVLFVGAGAFHSCSPSDLLPEIQGRLPIRAALEPLTQDVMQHILVDTKNCLVGQQVQLLSTEGIELSFDEDAVEEMAAIAVHLNCTQQNIGARRLRAVVDRVLEDVSFNAPDQEPARKYRLHHRLRHSSSNRPPSSNCNPQTTRVRISADDVVEKTKPLLDRVDLHKFLL